MSVLSTQYSVEFELDYDMFYINSVFTESLTPPPPGLLWGDKKPPLLDVI